MNDQAPMGGRSRRLRPGPFGAGVLSGLVAILVFIAWQWAQGPRPADYDTHIRSSGADLSRRGASTIVFRDRRDTVRQTCNGACDDLRMDAAGSEYGYDVEVRDAKGACIACAWSPGPADGKTITSELPGLGVSESTPIRN